MYDIEKEDNPSPRQGPMGPTGPQGPGATSQFPRAPWDAQVRRSTAEVRRSTAEVRRSTAEVRRTTDHFWFSFLYARPS